MKEDETRKEIQNAYMELQSLNQQINHNHAQLQAIGEQVNELNSTLESINELKNSKKGSQILVPLSSGIFTKAGLMDDKECIVNVGAGTAVKKSFDDAKKLIDEQIANLTGMQNQITSNTEQLMANAISIEKTMKNLVVDKDK